MMDYRQKVDLTKYIEESAFNFDYAFDESSNNDQIYSKAVRPLVQSAFMGARVTCFAYGQTGSGKTYTMNGDLGNGVPGLYILGARDIFAYQSNKQFQHLKVQVSFFEIYCGRLFDLLNNRSELKLREDNKANVHIVGLQERPLYSPEQFMQVIEYGSKIRITSQNSTNADSSRSHAILQITLKDGKKVFGKMSFIDLAGCERGADHMDQNKQTRIDGAEINKSLLSLKECIRALDQGKGHTPFRGSKLTMVLKDSFVGFCKTVMIGNISPNISSCENTLNTLRYADRVKQLKKPGEREALSKQEQLAKELMLPRTNKNAVKIMIDSNDDAEDIQLKKLEAQKQLGIKNVGDEYGTQPQVNSSMNMMSNSMNNNMGMMGNNNSMNLGMGGMSANNSSASTTHSNQFARGKMNIEEPPRGSNLNNNSNSLMAGKKPSGQSIPKLGLKKEPEKQPASAFSNNNNNLVNQRPSDLFEQPGRGGQIPTRDKAPVNVPPPMTNNLFPQNGSNNNSNLFQPNQFNNNQAGPGQGWSGRNMQTEQTQVRQPNGYSQNGQQPHGYSPSHGNNFNFGGLQPQNNMQNPNAGYANPGIYNQYNQQSQQPQPPQNFQQPNNQYGNNWNNNPPQQLFGAPRGTVPQNAGPAFGQNNNQQQMANRPTINPNSMNNSGYQQNNFQQGGHIQQQNNSQNNFEWKGVIKNFNQWNPTDQQQINPNNMHYFKDGLEYLMEQLLEEENSVAATHSGTVSKEVEIIKEEMKVISEFQNEKDNYESIEYANFIERSIENKINQLLGLKKKVLDFKDHLLQFEECEQKLNAAMDQLYDDQQLLDDLDNNQEQLY